MSWLFGLACHAWGFWWFCGWVDGLLGKMNKAPTIRVPPIFLAQDFGDTAAYLFWQLHTLSKNCQTLNDVSSPCLQSNPSASK